MVVGSSSISKKENQPLAVTCCHLLSIVVIVVIRCHSLSYIVTHCHLLYHSLPLDVSLVCVFINNLLFTTRCHSLSLIVPLVVTRCHSLYHSSVFLLTICFLYIVFLKVSKLKHMLQSFVVYLHLSKLLGSCNK